MNHYEAVEENFDSIYPPNLIELMDILDSLISSSKDKDKNWFVKGNPSRGLTTFYKPEKRIGYYNEQLEEDLKHGGSNK